MQRFFSSVVAAGLLLAATPALAQTWPPLDDVPQVEQTGAGDVAVVVAVEDYAFLPDVPGAAKNAAEWEQFLKDGLGVDSVLMLTNQQAVKEEILEFARRGAANAKKGSTLWFVFIGHGAPNKAADDGLLIGADGQQNANSMQARGVPQKELLATLEKGKQAKTVVLIDACFSGRDASGGALAKGTMPVLALKQAPVVKSSTVVMTAAKADEFAGALPDTERPAFSYLMLGAMRGWADDGDGEVTADEAVTFARRELLGIPGRQQTPQLTGSANLLLSKGVAEPKPQLGTRDVERPTEEEPTTTTPAGPSVTDVAPPPGRQTPDGKPDSNWYANAHGGIGLSAGGSIGYGVTGSVGAKLGELRLGGVLGVTNPADPDVPTSGSLDTERGNTIAVDGSTQNKTNQLGVLAGATVGYGLRRETTTRDDVVFIDAVAGVLAGKACQSYQYNTSKAGIVCSSSTSAVAPVFGARLGGSFGLVSVGATIGYRAYGRGDVVALIGAGVAFDD